MDKSQILIELATKHKITLKSEIVNNSIKTTVLCPYWVTKEVELSISHNAEEYSITEAHLYHVDKVLKMAGLTVSETLTHTGGN